MTKGAQPQTSLKNHSAMRPNITARAAPTTDTKPAHATVFLAALGTSPSDAPAGDGFWAMTGADVAVGPTSKSDEEVVTAGVAMAVGSGVGVRADGAGTGDAHDEAHPQEVENSESVT